MALSEGISEEMKELLGPEVTENLVGSEGKLLEWLKEDEQRLRQLVVDPIGTLNEAGILLRSSTRAALSKMWSGQLAGTGSSHLNAIENLDVRWASQDPQTSPVE